MNKYIIVKCVHYLFFNCNKCYNVTHIVSMILSISILAQKMQFQLFSSREEVVNYTKKNAKKFVNRNNKKCNAN